MQYYEVLVATMQYHGSEALTYSWDRPLHRGTIVRVALRNRMVLGIVVKKVTKPSFSVKPIAAVAPVSALPAESLQLLTWLYAYYPAPLGAVVRLFVPPTVAAPQKTVNVSNEVSNARGEAAPSHTSETGIRVSDALPPLTDGQQKALAAIQGPGTFLLHGVTGSGKSRVYLELVQRAFEAGRSALVLTPEIGLTAQLTGTFQAVFGDAVFVLHSQQTAAQRRDIWFTLLARGEPAVVIGPRSALFAPLRGLGLIVLDEAHDNAYKNESAPHYQAKRVAATLASLHQATLVLGSATPSVEDYYLAGEKQRPIIEMQELAIGADARMQSVEVTAEPTTDRAVDIPLHIELVDMKKAENFTRGSLISNQLIATMSAAMERGEQSLVFLNRRGTANVVLCNACGWQSICPNCDLSLTYHGDTHELRCHVCGYKSPLPTSCPVCANTDILFKSVGTKAVVEALKKLFPQALLQRFDTDAKKADRLEQQLVGIAGGSADIIVGTQMVGKGLDLPKLSVVGIINADTSLLIPDYTAAEQTYQLLAQVVGRVGRGHRAGTVIVQTYDPENQTLQVAVHRRWPTFYQAELAERKTYHFPPFTYLLKLTVMRATSASAEKAAAALTKTLAKQYPGLIVDGPAPSFHPRERGKYSWQLLVKASQRPVLVNIIATLPSGWNYDIDPVNLL